jgi:proliferating cell nuclear antigen
VFLLCLEQDKVSEFELKLMDIDSEHLGIPGTEYKAIIKMPSGEFQRICRDLSVIGDTGMLVLFVWASVLFHFQLTLFAMQSSSPRRRRVSSLRSAVTWVLDPSLASKAQLSIPRYAVVERSDVNHFLLTIFCHQTEDTTVIELKETVSLTFALRYLNFFTKATPLSSTVTLKMSKDVPLVVEYKIGDFGNLSYYLAPKIDEEES